MAALENDLVPATQTVISARLTLKQERFIRHYIETGNGTEAARLAGYDGNDVTLAAVAAENIRKPHIANEIKRLCHPIADAEEVLTRLTKYSRSSIADVLTDDGSFDLSHAKEQGNADLIRRLKFDKDTGRVVDVEIHDAKDATVHLGKVHKLFTDKVETELSDDAVDRITSGFIERLMELRGSQLGPTTDGSDEG